MALFLQYSCTPPEVEMPEHSTVEQPTDLNGAIASSDIEETLFTPLCCNCTMTVTNRSNIYTTVVGLSPDWPIQSCGPLFLNAALTPSGTPNSSATASNMVYTVGYDGLPNIFYLSAVNAGDEHAQTDCVNLKSMSRIC
jgi:hypothetical protein